MIDVRVPKLPLDQRQRDALVQQLDGVRMPESVRREPPRDPSPSGEVAQLCAHCSGRPRSASTAEVRSSTRPVSAICSTGTKPSPIRLIAGLVRAAALTVRVPRRTRPLRC